MPQIISIDIGSTYTKGALYDITDETLKLLAKEITPTTQGELATGFDEVYMKLARNAQAPQFCFSSSAKGGLAVVAIGLVPDLTAKVAREAALSAGAKVIADYSYKLTHDDTDEIRAMAPDIILLTGGFDGGNEEYLIHNAAKLAAAALPCPIIFAGNRAAKDAVCRILDGHNLHCTQNLLPAHDEVNVEPARSMIRHLFLEEIIEGKGLSVIVERTGCTPLPTPYAMLELVERIATMTNFGELCVVDVGGATTDFYSYCRPHAPKANVIVRGLPEPLVKRTVEGDLGMRVSAASVPESSPELVNALLHKQSRQDQDLRAFAERVTDEPDLLPTSTNEVALDQVLAGICAFTAAKRHAGRQRIVFTHEGERFVQQGKDLRGIDKIVGTGGYLSSAEHCDAMAIPHGFAGEALLPKNAEFLVDLNYQLPLLANIAMHYPAQAARAAIDGFRTTHKRINWS